MRNNSNEIASIENRLRSERPSHAAPHGLAERVMSRVTSNLTRDPGAEVATPVSLWPRFALGLATVTVLTLASLSYLRDRTQLSRVETPVPEPLQLAIPTVPTASLAELSHHLDQPLERELQNVLSDTRQAIHFVAASFLPEN